MFPSDTLCDCSYNRHCNDEAAEEILPKSFVNLNWSRACVFRCSRIGCKDRDFLGRMSAELSADTFSTTQMSAYFSQQKTDLIHKACDIS